VLFADLLLLRHRFCLGVCPYGILQNIVQDGRTLGVELDPERRAECTDCLLCVRACFMGVDIRRQAFDPACLNCGDCIAATTLSRTCPAEPLIRFRYGTVPSRWPTFLRRAGVLDLRRALVMALVIGVTGATAAFLAGRQDLEADVAALFDRAALTPDGTVRNSYRLTVSNRLAHPIHLRLDASGVPELAIVAPVDGIDVAAGEEQFADLVLRAPAAQLETGPHDILFRGRVDGSDAVVELATHLYVPTRR
jgi:polyferredoxin